MTKNIETLLNTQIQIEFSSAYVYLAMAARCEERSLKGSAKWFSHHAKEELEHGMRIYRYLHERGATVRLKEITAPDIKGSEVSELFKQAYEHEVYVTRSIQNIVLEARKEKDVSTERFLDWFLEEQDEEEDVTRTALERLEIAGEAGLFLFDKEMEEEAGE